MSIQWIAQNDANTGTGVDFDDIEKYPGCFIVIHSFPMMAPVGGLDDYGTIGNAYGHCGVLVECPNIPKVLAWIGTHASIESQFMGGIELAS